jgi:hypothetical protein
MSTKWLTRLAFYAALGIVLRFLFSSFPNVKPVTAYFLLLVEVLGLPSSLLVMAVTLLLSGLIYGFSVSILFQILGYALSLWIWSRFRHPILIAVLPMLYGVFNDVVFASLYQMPLMASLVGGLWFNILHAVSTVVFYPIGREIFARLGLMTSSRRVDEK